MDSTTIVLSFTPAVKCWHCGQPASYGVFDVGAQEMRIGCPTHGSAWDGADLGAEMASMETSAARVLARLAEAYLAGIAKRDICARLRWGGNKYRHKVKPVLDALQKGA